MGLGSPGSVLGRSFVQHSGRQYRYIDLGRAPVRASSGTSGAACGLRAAGSAGRRSGSGLGRAGCAGAFMGSTRCASGSRTAAASTRCRAAASTARRCRATATSTGGRARATGLEPAGSRAGSVRAAPSVMGRTGRSAACVGTARGSTGPVGRHAAVSLVGRPASGTCGDSRGIVGNTCCGTGCPINRVAVHAPGRESGLGRAPRRRGRCPVDVDRARGTVLAAVVASVEHSRGSGRACASSFVGVRAAAGRERAACCRGRHDHCAAAGARGDDGHSRLAAARTVGSRHRRRDPADRQGDGRGGPAGSAHHRVRA